MWVSLGMLLALVSAPAAEVRPASDVKAVLLYNFTQFVDWPATAFANPEAPLVIGVIGRDPYGPTLDELVHGEKVGRHPLQVVRIRDAGAAEQVHVLYISASERSRVADILEKLQGKPVLTVADFDGFLHAGGIARFYRNAENKIRVRINLPAARAANLTFSAKLLRVVEIVPPEEE